LQAAREQQRRAEEAERAKAEREAAAQFRAQHEARIRRQLSRFAGRRIC
jgi:hypothetical protein